MKNQISGCFVNSCYREDQPTPVAGTGRCVGGVARPGGSSRPRPASSPPVSSLTSCSVGQCWSRGRGGRTSTVQPSLVRQEQVVHADISWVEIAVRGIASTRTEYLSWNYLLSVFIFSVKFCPDLGAPAKGDSCRVLTEFSDNRSYFLSLLLWDR